MLFVAWTNIAYRDILVKIPLAVIFGLPVLDGVLR